MGVETNFKCFLISLFLLSVPFVVCAESVKPLNPDCVVCPVVISYDGSEAKKILGDNAAQQILNLGKIKQKIIKIDLDGVKEIGLEKDSDAGYELLVIIYPNLIAINPIQGSAGIKIKTDFQKLKISYGDIQSWTPVIELMPQNGQEINKTDDLQTAWSKMKLSNLYEYVNNTKDHKQWNGNFKKFLRKILETANRK